jgi:hypothetical protein
MLFEEHAAVAAVAITPAGAQQQGELDIQPPSPFDTIWGTAAAHPGFGKNTSHGPRTHPSPPAPSFTTSATPYAPWLLVSQPQAPQWPHTQVGLANVCVRVGL